MTNEPLSFEKSEMVIELLLMAAARPRDLPSVPAPPTAAPLTCAPEFEAEPPSAATPTPLARLTPLALPSRRIR